MQAVNSTPDGEWIAANEEHVRNFSAELPQRVFEQAVEQRIDVVGPRNPTAKRALRV